MTQTVGIKKHYQDLLTALMQGLQNLMAEYILVMR